jgi:hypothetical protein
MLCIISLVVESLPYNLHPNDRDNNFLRFELSIDEQPRW